MIKNSNILVGSAKPLVKQLEKYSKEEFTKNVLAVYDEAIENYKKRA